MALKSKLYNCFTWNNTLPHVVMLDGTVVGERHECSAQMLGNEETADDHRVDQGSTHVLRGAKGEVQQRENAIRQRIQAELDPRCV